MSQLNPIWLLIDASDHLYRDWHATGGVGGHCISNIVGRIEGMREEFRPDRIVVAFDSPTNFRKTIEPNYKANRPPKPEQLLKTVDRFRKLCLEEEIDVVESEGFEGDDCLATLTRIARQSKRRVILSSADKDLKQLLESGAVTQLRSYSRQRGSQWVTAADVRDDYGLEPSQWVDYQTLVGDRTDNVVGAEAIGDVAARAILRRCGSIEGFYADLWSAPITNRQRDNMLRFRPRVDVVRQLVTLRQDVPLPEWEAVA